MKKPARRTGSGSVWCGEVCLPRQTISVPPPGLPVVVMMVVVMVMWSAGTALLPQVSNPAEAFVKKAAIAPIGLSSVFHAARYVAPAKMVQASMQTGRGVKHFF